MNRRFDQKAFFERLARYEKHVRDAALGKLDDLHPYIKDCYYYGEADNKPFQYAVICIPGRGNDGADFAMDYFEQSGLKNTVFVGPTPKKREWYPMPYNAKNQKEAVAGLPFARSVIQEIIQNTTESFNIAHRNIVLAGFSAGGVMAINTAVHSAKTLMGVVCHAGAILDTKDVPDAQVATPMLLMHNRDDMCFEWFERYLPMKKTLISAGYHLYVSEKQKGGHFVADSDVSHAGSFIRSETHYKAKNSKQKRDSSQYREVF